MRAHSGRAYDGSISCASESGHLVRNSFTTASVSGDGVPCPEEANPWRRSCDAASCSRGCSVEARGENEEEVLKQAAVHAKRDHGVTEIDAATLAKVKAAIRPA